MSRLLAEEMFVLFAILAVGSWIGQLSIRRVSLGSAAVFFVALVFGHFGFSVPKVVMDLGLLLFVYAVGLQAGPRFFRTFRRQGQQFVMIALATVLTGAAVTVGVTWLLHLPFELAAGLYTGALTNTPALAAAIDAVTRIAPARAATVSVGYGVAYPYSLILIVLLIQFMPRLLRRDLKNEEACWQQEQEAETPRLQARRYLITNPNCDGLLLREVNPHRMSLVNISRVRHNDTVSLARPDMILHMGDVVMAVGPEDELAKLRVLLGEETEAPMDTNANVVSVDAEITQTTLLGKSLGDLKVWERYGVVITRIRRQGLELAPTGTSTLDMGDMLRVVGERAAVDAFVQVMGGARRADDTNMVPFLGGLLLGIVVGLIPFDLPNGIEIKLGIAGGAFIVSLLVGHFGRIGPFRLYVPTAAKNLSRELGLMLFLAGAGTTAGARLVSILAQQGWQLLAAGALITTVAAGVALLLMDRVYRLNVLCTMGALCGAMTNPPGLNAANIQTETDLPTLAYASIYPVALIFKIVGAQLLVEILRRVGS
jgi:putative transport protein